MGRTRVFDYDTVVRAARAVFWQHGYEGASLPDLETATDLNRSSIYHAFGSKRGLFDAAVQSYLAEIVQPRLVPLTVAPVAPSAIIDYLNELKAALSDSESSSARNGCLLLNAAGAPISHDDSVRETISAYHNDLHSAFLSGVVAKFPGLDPADQKRIAVVCTSAVVAALMLARINSQAGRASLDAALGTLAAAEAASVEC